MTTKSKIADKNKKIAVYPGTFDPFTNGHLDIVERALRIFDELIIVVAHSDRKSPLIPADERVRLIRSIMKDRPQVSVDMWNGLIVNYARAHKAGSLVRGLRAASDFEYEFMMASMNREISSSIDTVFLMTGENLYFVSSTMVKELVRFGGNAAPYLPKTIYKYLENKRKKGEIK